MMKASVRPGFVLLGFLGLGLVSVGFLDRPLEAWLAGLRAAGVRLPWVAAAEALPPLVAAGCATWLLALAVLRRLRGDAAVGAAVLLLSVVGPVLAALPLKHAVGRGRPCCSGGQGHLHVEPFAFLDAFASFPSAQSAMAAGLAVALVLVLPRLWIPAMVLALVIGLGRLFTGAHWASDVVMGWGLGAALGLWAARLSAWRKGARSGQGPG